MYYLTIIHNLRLKTNIYEVIEIRSDGIHHMIFRSEDRNSVKIFLDTIGFRGIDLTRKYNKREKTNIANIFNFDFSEYYF